MKKLLALFMILALMATMIACDKDTDPTTPAPDPTPADVGAEGWVAMLSESNYSNYTFTMSGTMTTVQGGETITSYAKQTVKFDNDKMAMGLFEDENDTEGVWQTFEGDLAITQETQMTQLFILMLEKYERYAYDAAANSYKLTNTVTIDAVLKGFRMDEHGNIFEMDVPTVIEMRNGEVTLSDDGKLVKFVCDYTQNMYGGALITSGVTTWTFYDYGTTVVA